MKRIYIALFGVIVLFALFGRPRFLGPPIPIHRSVIYQPVQSPWIR